MAGARAYCTPQPFTSSSVWLDVKSPLGVFSSEPQFLLLFPPPPTPPRRYPLSGSHRPGRPRPQGGAITAARALRRRGASPALSRRSAGPRAVRGRLAVPPGVPHRAGLLPETNPGRCQNRGPAQRAAVRCEAASEALRTERVSLRRRESFFLLVFLPTKQRDTHEFLRPEEPAACVRFCAAVRVAVNKANVS